MAPSIPAALACGCLALWRRSCGSLSKTERRHRNHRCADVQTRRQSVVKFTEPDRDVTFHRQTGSETAGGRAPEGMLATSTAALERGGETQREKAGGNGELKSPVRGMPDREVLAGNPVGRRKSSAAGVGRSAVVQSFSEVSPQVEAVSAADERDSGAPLESPVARADTLRGWCPPLFLPFSDVISFLSSARWVLRQAVRMPIG